MSFYRTAVTCVGGICKVFLFYKARGKENIPGEGAFLLCSNHRSFIDPVLIAASCRRDLAFMSKEELFKKPVLGWLIKKLGAFPIKRGRGDAAAVMTTLKIMKKGEGTLIFPEGTRMKKGERKQINSGIIRLAIQAGVPIVPAFVSANKVVYAPAVKYDQYIEKVQDSELMQSLADSLMDTIYSLGEKQ